MRPIDAIIRLRDQFTPVLRNINRQMQQHSQAQVRFGREVEQVGKSISGFSKKAAMMAAPLLAAAAAGLKLGSDFTKGLAKVSTLVDTSVVDMEKIRKGILQISNDTGVSVVDLAESEYQAISAGVSAAKSIEFLNAATKSAKAGFTDSTTAINALTTVLNSYRMTAEDATKISDQMLIAQNLGKTTFGEMAQSMGPVITQASNLNIATEEVFASVAALTKNGVQTDRAMTSLQAAFSSVLSPAKEVTETAARLGINFNAAHLQSVGWARFLQEIREKTGGNAQEIANLFPNVRALTGMLVLAGKAGTDFDASLEAMQNSAGATDEAFQKLLTPAEKTAIAMNQLKNAGMELSQGLAPFLKSTTVMIKQLVTWMNALTDEQRDMLAYTLRNIVIFIILTGVIGKVVSTAGKCISVFGKMNASIKELGVIGSLKDKFPLATKAMQGLANGFKVAGNGIKTALISAGTPIVNFGKTMFSAFRHPQQAARSFTASVKNAISSAIGAMGRAAASAKGIAMMIINAVKNPMVAIKMLTSGIKTGVLTVVNLLKGNLIGAIKAVGSALRLMFMNPLGIAIMVVIGLAIVIYTHWGAIKDFFIATFNAISDRVKIMAEMFSAKFGAIWEKAQNVFGRLVTLVGGIWIKITSIFSDGSGDIGKTIGTIGSILGAGFTTTLNIALNLIEMFIGAVCVVINGLLDVLGGIITFITGVFTGNWGMAWEGVVQIFSSIFNAIVGICEAVLDGIKASINSVISGVNSINVAIPEWVPGVGGETYTPNIPMLYKGTENWGGGVAMIHDRGAEIVDLPRGARVYPHDRSIQMAMQEGVKAGMGMMAMPRNRAAQNTPKVIDLSSRRRPQTETGEKNSQGSGMKIQVNIQKLADVVTVREDRDIEEIAKRSAQYVAAEIRKAHDNAV